ncbi:hypothetical protein LOTGIDRAFT_153023 [Lottia gigantea]|uniref:Uncharacterized protein n=1 Tax=Lottia gigantea TaxID=225164 RepID=V4AST5_LOTGI|nr:hypothetical protein LOTGIDRAFT_153023 [Lottia gigantea]ESO97915.1 hypothetical protein LOTGIDRAFT_153023 [Lottia gigantea]
MDKFCMSCVCTALKNGYSVYYIDTSCSFSASRIHELLGKQCENIESLLSSIQHKVCSDIFEIFEFLEEIITLLQTKKVTVSSVGYGLLVKLGQKLKYLAVQYSTTVLITNNVVYTEGSNAVPSLGRAWSHIPHTRIMIELNQQSNSLERKIVLIKSSMQAVPQECVYFIQEGVG